ncbi:MAG: T9SS type A sorting domain-containing protein [Bacteroidetes bacterium]|nr:MAG: T9SS type A sorting domain-containing protein [Bacteroidota bacterium]
MKIFKLLLIFIFLAIISTMLYSQELLWQKRYYPDEGERLYLPLITEIDGDILLVSFIRLYDGTDIFGNNKILISRITKHGDTVWNKKIILSRNIKAIKIIKNFNDNYNIYGLWNNNLLYYITINKSGELISEHFMESDLIGIGSFWSFLLSDDNNIITTYFDQANAQGLIVKYDSNFVITDSSRINFINEDTSIAHPAYYLVVQNNINDSCYLFSYYQIYPFDFFYFFITDKNLNIQQIRKYDSKLLGNEWEKFFIRYISQNEDDSFVGILNNSNPQGDSTIATIQFDSSGNIITINFFGDQVIYDLDKPNPGISNMSVTNIVKCNDKGYLLGCSYRYPALIKIGQYGNREWSKILDLLDTNMKTSINSIIQLSDSNYYVAESESQLQDTSKDIWKPLNNILVKMSNQPTNVLDYYEKDNIIQIIPNPAYDFIQLHFTDDIKLFDVEIYNVLGIKMLETEYKDRIDVSRLCAGVYFLKAGAQVYKFVKM